MKHFYSLCILNFALCIILLSGCSSGNIPLSGKVMFEDDGTPLTSGIILFDDGTHLARASIQPNGTFTAGYDKQNNGLPKGHYGISIIGTEEMLPNPEDVYPPPMRPRIAPKYSQKETSGLYVDVDGSSRTFDIKVERAQRKDK